MNDIEILQRMLIRDIQVPLQCEKPGSPFVKLTDKQAETTVEIRELPRDTIVIKAEEFKFPITVFESLKGQRRRADFVIVSSDESGKWIICIETQRRNAKTAAHVVGQLKGAQCFISYCKCIGRSFWESEEFLEGYEYRFVSIANIGISTQSTRPFHRKGELHSRPETFLKILGRQILYFYELTEGIHKSV